MILSIVSAVVSLLILCCIYRICVFERDAESFKDRQKYLNIVFYITGALHLAVTFLIAYFSGEYLMTGTLMIYVSFFLYCDVLIKNTYTYLNYLYFLIMFAFLFANSADLKDVGIIVAGAFGFVIAGYLGAYGHSDGYMFAILLMFFKCIECTVFAYPAMLLILSTLIAIVFIHVPLYIYDKVKNNDIKFDRCKRAFAPAIYAAFLIITGIHFITR